MKRRVQEIPTDAVGQIRAGGPGAHGRAPGVRIAEGYAERCRRLLGSTPRGGEKRVLA